MKRIVFWGATGQARVLHEALLSTDCTLMAVFDNRKLASPFPGVPLLVGREAFLAWRAQNSADAIHFCVAVGGNRGQERLELQDWLQEQGLIPLTVAHPRSFIAANASVGAGSQILALAGVGAHTSLGRAVIVNTAATVDHDCVLGDGVHLAPGAHLAGEVRVEAHAFIGMGALVLPRLQIGRGAVVGAGSVVTRDVAAGDTVIGTPARQVSATL